MASLLIVDDDAIILNMIFDLFSEEYLCQKAATAEDALTQLKAHDYDLVITDIFMPGMSGEDLLGFIKVYRPRTPVLFISGAANREYAERLMAKGAFDYLLKPFRLEELEQRVTRAIKNNR